MYALPRTCPWEPEFPFQPEETVEHTDASAFLPSIDWEKRTKKKWCVLSAPMGSGKTQQLTPLVDKANREKLSVCFVSYRRLLATQQANRLGLENYLELDTDELRHDSPTMLVVSVDSLYKLGPHQYDYVVLDECGLTRRHFLSSTCASVLGQVYERFVRLVREASFVVMLQDGISRDDVQFYMELDNMHCEDRARLSAMCFKKPIEVHPIRYTTNSEIAVANMIRSYESSVDRDGNCKHPFMVFCSQATYAEFLTTLLREKAEKMGADPKRIKGMWSNMRDGEFFQKFATDPNETAAMADVVVCTTVVGAGFSITRHFEHFHAFLFNMILRHDEEQQFVRRLRFMMDYLPDGALRQSYMYLEKDSNNVSFEYKKVLADFNVVRNLLTSTNMFSRDIPVAPLEQTQARIATEKAESRSKHFTLWKEWGNKIKSPFEEFDDTDNLKFLAPIVKEQFRK